MNIYWYEHTGAHNIGHFLDDMCIPFYGLLKSQGLLGKDFQVIMKRNPDSSGKFVLPDAWNFLSKHPVKYVDSHKNIGNNFRKIMLAGKHGGVDRNKLIDLPSPNKHYKNFANELLNYMGVKREKPKRIVQLLRSNKRSIVNQKELTQGLQSLGLEVYTVEYGKMSFKEQLKSLQDCKVLVGYHGGALMNTLFTPFNSSTLEVLPYGWAYPRYKKVATYLGQNYIQWTNPDVSKTIINYPTDFDTSVTPAQNRAILDKRQYKKGSKKYNKAIALKRYFQHQDTIVDVDAIVNIVKKVI